MKKFTMGLIIGAGAFLLMGAAQFYFSGPIASTALSGYSASLGQGNSSTILLGGIAFSNITGSAGIVVAQTNVMATTCTLSVTFAQTNGISWLTNYTTGFCVQAGSFGGTLGTNTYTLSMQVAAGNSVGLTNNGTGTIGIIQSYTNSLY